jgi:SPP1 family predicted phage head-tail adaptor
MNAGKLDRRICIQTATTTADATGQAVRTWSDVAQVWAAVEQVAASESTGISQVTPQKAIKVTIRYLCGIDSGVTRIVYQSRNYDVLDAREIGRGQWLEIDARSVTGGEQG